MVLGCLVACGGPLGRSGLGPRVRLPSGVAVHGFPVLGVGQTGWCRCGRPGGVGSSPFPILWWGSVTPFPSPGSLAEPTSSDHDRGGVMSADRVIGVLVLQGGEPVLGAPSGGVGRVDRDDRPRRCGTFG